VETVAVVVAAAKVAVAVAEVGLVVMAQTGRRGNQPARAPAETLEALEVLRRELSAVRLREATEGTEATAARAGTARMVTRATMERR
jgi:hypothetical protein